MPRSAGTCILYPAGAGARTGLGPRMSTWRAYPLMRPAILEESQLVAAARTEKSAAAGATEIRRDDKPSRARRSIEIGSRRPRRPAPGRELGASRLDFETVQVQLHESSMDMPSFLHCTLRRNEHHRPPSSAPDPTPNRKGNSFVYAFIFNCSRNPTYAEHIPVGGAQ